MFLALTVTQLILIAGYVYIAHRVSRLEEKALLDTDNRLQLLQEQIDHMETNLNIQKLGISSLQNDRAISEKERAEILLRLDESIINEMKKKNDSEISALSFTLP